MDIFGRGAFFYIYQQNRIEIYMNTRGMQPFYKSHVVYRKSPDPLQ